MTTFNILNWMGDIVETIEGTEEEARSIANDKTAYHSVYSNPYTYEVAK